MKKNKLILALILIVSISLVVSGCAAFDGWMNKIKGNLVGQHFEVSFYDNSANKTLDVSGSKITVGLLENSANFSSEGGGFKSEVLEITINGKQMFQVGNTVVFAEDGIDMVEGFEAPKEVIAPEGGGFVPMDRLVNRFKNAIGKEKTIIISSQLGIPIGVYQGNNVFVSIPDDLPKMTLITIDGKSLYIHRANYIILDSELID